MKVDRLRNEDKEAYEKLAIKFGSVFNTLSWLNHFGDAVEVFGIYGKGDRLIGGFSLYKEKRWGLTIYRNPPFTPAAGPFLEVGAVNSAEIMGAWKRVLSLVAEFIENLPYALVSISLGRNIVDTQPFIWRKFKVTPGYTYILELGEPLTNIRQRMSAERRNDVSKAARDGLTVRQVDDLNIVYLLIRKTFSRQEKEIDECLLRKILFGFAGGSNSFAFAVFRGDDPIAAVFCVHDGDTAYYLLGGYDDAKKHHGAGAMAVAEAIGYAKELGLAKFDFEGSMVMQIEKYFRGFGGNLVPYFRVNRAILPIEIALKFIKREIF